MADAPILVPGTTCWRRVRSDRISFLVDGEAYFRPVADAIEQARSTIYLLGWDFDTRVRLRSDGTEPAQLGGILKRAVDRAPALEVYILEWDFAVIYALERQFLPMFSLGPLRHKRIHFRFDGKIPPGASHHQKVAVIDDRLAFAGGLDLTGHRWDTPEHRPGDPRRTTPAGDLYPPFHDLQAAVSGPAAAALGDLFRERWRRAAGREPARPPESEGLWVDSLETHLHAAEVGISRTEPAWADRPEIRETEALHRAAIGSARRWIYFENQYVTSAAIGDALAECLAREDGPEVVIVLPRDSSGWLEQSTMDVLRTRLFRRLRDVDRRGRLKLYSPAVGETAVYMHAKTFVVDDGLLHIGSANLSNRSMGFDTECGVSVEAGGREDARTAIAAYRNRLLAEHLGVTEDLVRARLSETGSLIGTIESLQSKGRSLRPFHREIEDWRLEGIPDREIIDPERPIDLDHWIRSSFPPEERRRAGLKVWARAIPATLALAAATTGILEPSVLDALTPAGPAVLAPLWICAFFLAGTFLLVPVGVIAGAAVVAFGPWAGGGWALLGWSVGAAAAYALGRGIDRNVVRRLSAGQLNRISRRLSHLGFLAMVTSRLLPLAPSGLVSLVCGASRVRFGDFLLGGLAGTVPILLAAAVFADRLEAAIRVPEPGNKLLVVLAWAGILGFLLAQSWWLNRSEVSTNQRR